MKQIITEVGLLLGSDPKRSAVDNLFRQLFGRWPTSPDFRDKRMGELKQLLEKTKNYDGTCSDSIYPFFGFLECKAPLTISECDPELINDVSRALHILRTEYTLDILCIYDEDIGVDMYEIVKENRKLSAEAGNVRSQLHEATDELYVLKDKMRKAEARREEVLNSHITTLPAISEEIVNILAPSNIHIVRELVSHTAYEIRSIDGMDDDSFVALTSALASVKLYYSSPSANNEQ